MPPKHQTSGIRKLTAALIAVVTVLAVVTAGGGYIWHREQQEKALLQAQYAALVKQKDELALRLNELQAQSDSFSEDQQLQIDTLSEALAQAQQTMEELDNTVAQLSISLGGKSSSVPVYFAKPDCAQDAKLIALTFDDGPSPQHTPRLLDELKKRGVHATFFVVGQSIKGNEEILRRIHEEGHAIGNHTLNHKNLAEESIDDMRKQLSGCSDLVEQAIGIRPAIARMPGGKLNEDTRAVLAELGLPTIGWSVDTRDWESKNVDAILKETFKNGKYGARDGAIILMHDRYDTSVDAALLIVDRLLEEGYTFVTVPELLAARKSVVLTGALYSSAFPSEE